MSLNLAVLLEESARKHPDKPALILGPYSIKYRELLAASRKFANALDSLGVQPGEKVAIMLPNVPQFAAVYYGILIHGSIAVPLNVLFKSREVSYHLDDSDATTLVVWEGMVEEAAKGFEQVERCRHLIVVESPFGKGIPDDTISFNQIMTSAEASREMSQPMADDTAVVLYTSGTTGQPKGAELTHFNLFYNAVYSAEHLQNVTEDDVVMGALPFFHVFGQTCVLNAFLYKGATIVMLPRFEPEAALKAIQERKITVFVGVPTMYQYMLHFPDRQKYDASSLRLCISGGSAMPMEVLHEFERVFNVTILEGYGLSETSPVVCFNETREERKVGSIGKAIWGTELRVVGPDDKEVSRGERGELVVRGHPVMRGYYKRPKDTGDAMRDGWFHTGDVATMDEDGYVYIVDRIKDMILRGGYNVYPREVEEVLYEHPAVSECAVFGVPHPELGEEVYAAIVLKPGQNPTEDEVISFVKERVAAYKYPRTVLFVEAMPKTATGKILKRALASEAEETMRKAS